MILPILAFFLLLIGALAAFGYWQKEPSLVIIAYSLLFVIGMIGIFEGLQYQTGEVRVVDGNTTTISYVYDTYEPESWFGFRPFFWLMIIGGLGFAVTLIEMNDRYRRYRDE